MNKIIVTKGRTDRKKTTPSLFVVENFVTSTSGMGYKLEIPRLGTEGNLITAFKAGHIRKVCPSLAHQGRKAYERGHDIVFSFRRATHTSYHLPRTKAVTDGDSLILNEALR